MDTTKKHRRYFHNNFRQYKLTGIKERKTNAELHRRETVAHTNIRQQALTEITKEEKTKTKLHQTETAIRIGNLQWYKKEDEHEAQSNRDCDTNREFPIVIQRY